MNKSPSEGAALQARCEALQREHAELTRFALIGQAFLGLAHELNNALNTMMLQTSVVQLRVDEQARRELAAIRQHGAHAAGLLASLQHTVEERRENAYAVDLNGVLAEVLEEAGALNRQVSAALTPNTPPIQSTRSAVKQLVRLVLEGVCASTKSTVRAATAEQHGDVVLSLMIVGDKGSPSAVEDVPWGKLDEVGRLAGQSLLRNLGGALTSELEGDSLTIRVKFKQAP
jgi:phosphoglycerate-specific signal transduction histidine kinase